MIKTTSKKLSKQLKDAGARQESAYEWVKHSLNKKPVLFTKPVGDEIIAVLSGKVEYRYSAFTAEECLEALPARINSDIRNGYFLSVHKHAGGGWGVVYSTVETPYPLEQFGHKSLAEASGQMMLYCLENGYLKV